MDIKIDGLILTDRRSEVRGKIKSLTETSGEECEKKSYDEKLIEDHELSDSDNKKDGEVVNLYGIIEISTEDIKTFSVNEKEECIRSDVTCQTDSEIYGMCDHVKLICHVMVFQNQNSSSSNVTMKFMSFKRRFYRHL